MRLAALDGHPIVLEGIRELVERAEGRPVEWLGSATTVAGLHALLATTRPDVVLFEPVATGADAAEEAVRWLADRGIAVVVFTSDRRPVPVRRAIRAGARGVALKHDDLERLLGVVLAAADGSFAVSSAEALRLVSDGSLAPELPPRELEVLRLLASGVPRKSVGRYLDPPVQLATVVTYVNRACRRYQDCGRDVRTGAEAVRAACECGHLEAPRPPWARGGTAAVRPAPVTPRCG